MKYEILPMQARHVPQIAALERLCFSDPWNEAAVGGELENPLSLWLVAEQNGAVLGYVGSQMVPPEADMMNIAVAPEARRQGIAEALIGELICRLSVNGVTSLSLEVRACGPITIFIRRRMRASSERTGRYEYSIGGILLRRNCRRHRA